MKDAEIAQGKHDEIVKELEGRIGKKNNELEERLETMSKLIQKNE